MIVRLVTTGDDSSAVRHAFGGALAPSDIREGTAVSRGISHSNFKHHVSFCIVLGMVAIDTLHSVHTYSSGLRHAGSTSGVVFNPKNLRLATAQLPIFTDRCLSLATAQLPIYTDRCLSKTLASTSLPQLSFQTLPIQHSSRQKRNPCRHRHNRRQGPSCRRSSHLLHA